MPVEITRNGRENASVGAGPKWAYKAGYLGWPKLGTSFCLRKKYILRICEAGALLGKTPNLTASMID
jgi:hypothetical protein